MVDATPTKVSATEFFDLPETMTPMQLIDGDIHMAPAPSLYHQDSVFRVAKLIEQISPEGKVYIAPVDVYLDDSNVVQPDVVYLTPESQATRADEGKRLRGAPELVVEVFSPGSVRQDRLDKFRLYEQHGVREYWMVDPMAATLEIWTRQGEVFARQDVYAPHERPSSPLLGAEFDISHLFEAA